MNHRVYMFGYQGHRPEDLLAAVDHIGAMLCDIRYAPYSRQPGWSKKSLQNLFSTAYLHVPQLGNLNYKGEYGEGIQIADMEGGLKVVLDLLEHRPVVLMCVCRNAEICHRTVVASQLRRYGAEVEELGLSQLR